MPNELKPCPFCGGKAVLNKGRDTFGYYYSVDCKDTNNCQGHFIHTKYFRKKPEAIGAWNRRAGNA